jgi:hypothetical protein
MDWNAAIEKNREALKRVLAMLVAIAGLRAALTSPLWGGRRSSDRRVGVLLGAPPPPDASRRPPLAGEVGPTFVLPRHLRLAVLRLLRPAEAAARRLIIVAARGTVVAVLPVRPRGPRHMAKFAPSPSALRADTSPPLREGEDRSAAGRPSSPPGTGGGVSRARPETERGVSARQVPSRLWGGVRGGVYR